MFHILAEVAPLKVDDGSRPVLRASSAQDRRLNGVAGERWWPAMSKRPSLAITLFDGDFTAEVAPGSASFTIRLNALENLDPGVRGYRWAGATVSLYAVDASTALNAAGSYDVASLDALRIFKGRVEGFALDGGALSMTADVDMEPFNTDVLRFEYAGTGDAEGGADLKGRLKPWIFGRALNVEPILINNVDNVVQFSAYSIPGISALYERGSSLGVSIGNYATYEQLVAATIPAGRWATCHARGMARLGAPPYGVITGDVDGDNGTGFIRTTGAIIRRVALDAGVAIDLLDTASLAALDAAVPYPINLVLTEQISVLDLARRLALPCNAQAGVDFLGRLFAVRPTIGVPSLTLDAQGRRLPPVRRCQEADVSPPYKRIMFGANRSWRVHTFDEIAFDAELIDRGDYDPAKTYRRGNIVSLPNGSRWLFVSNTPKAGSEPSEANADWELMTGAITAGNITYEDGTTVEALKPAEPGATQGAIIGVDIRIPEIPGIPAPPGLIRNDFLRFRADGMLTYTPYGDPAAAEELGTLTLPGIGAAEDSARRQLENAVDRLGAALLLVQSEASRTRETFRDAGVYVDPADGTVKIAAIEQTAERVNEASIRLSAAESAITLRATRTYVDNAVALAVLDPSQVPIFEGLDIRISSAELRLDGAEASLNLKADNLTVNAQGLRLNQAEIDIRALEGQIVLKVDSSTFDALGERVTSAEQTLEAIGDGASIRQAVIAARKFPDAVGDAQESALRALLAGDLSRRQTFDAVVAARTELTAKIEDDKTASALARQELIVRIRAAEVSAVTETELRVAGDRATARMVTNLSASMEGQFAGFDQRIIALVDNDNLILAGLTQTVSAVRGLGEDAADAAESALIALLSGDEVSRDMVHDLAAAREELTAKVNADVEAVAQRVYAILARMGMAEASIISVEIARAAADAAVASRLNQLSATLGGMQSRVTVEELARSDADEALAASIQTLRAEKIEGDEAIAAQLTIDRQARVDGDDALAFDLEELTATVSNVNARVSSEEIARADEDEALAISLQTLRADKDDDKAALSAQADIDRQARVDGDGALAFEVDALRVEKNTNVVDLAAGIDRANQARIDGDDVLAASVETLRAEKNADVADISAEVEIQRQARVDGDDALASEVASLRVEKDDNVADLAAGIDRANQARIDEGAALAASVETLRVEKNDDLASLSAEIVTERQARVDGDGALAAEVETLSATVGDTTAELNEQRAVLVDLEGRTVVSFRIEATDPDGTTYIGIERHGGTGAILLGGDVISPGTITAKEIEANGITRTYSAKNADAAVLTDEMANIVTFQVTMARPGAIMVNAVHQLVFATGGAWAAELKVQSTTLMSGSSNVDHQSVLFGEFQVSAPGTYVVTLRARRTAGSVSINAGGSALLVHRTYA